MDSIPRTPQRVAGSHPTRSREEPGGARRRSKRRHETGFLAGPRQGPRPPHPGRDPHAGGAAQARRCTRPRLGAPKREREEDAEEPQLCLKDVVAAQEEISRLKRAVEDRQQALEDGTSIVLQAIQDRSKAQEELLLAREAAESAEGRADCAVLETEREREERDRLEDEARSLQQMNMRLQAEVSRKDHELSVTRATAAAAAASAAAASSASSASSSLWARFKLPASMEGSRLEDMKREGLRAAQRKATSRDCGFLTATSGEPDARWFR